MRFDDYMDELEGLESLEFSLPKIKINVRQLFNRVKSFITGNKDKIQRTIAIWRPPQKKTTPPTPTTPAPPPPSQPAQSNNWLLPIGIGLGLFLLSQRR